MNRTFKRILSLLTAVLLLTAAACPAALAAKTSGTCGPNAKWTYDSGKKTLTISGKGKVTGGWQNAVGSQKVSVTIKKGITSIGNGAFMYTKMKKLTLPSTLKTLDEWALGNYDGMVLPDTLTIPKSVKTIKDYALSGRGLKTIKVEKGNKNYTSVKGVLFNKKKTKLLYFPGSRTGKYTVPKGTKEIAHCAFDESALTQLVVPAGVKKVGYNSFWLSPFKELVFLGKPPKGLNIDSACRAQNVFFRERYRKNWDPVITASRNGGFVGRWYEIYKGKWK